VNGPHVYQLATLGVAAVAAVFDWRKGMIPNWLTLGAIVAALPLHAWLTPVGPGHGPLDGVKWALVGALFCTLPCLVAWRLGWMAGGDVKLIAAMGALSGLALGLEAVFLALLCAGSFILFRLSWDGTFLRTVSDEATTVVARTLYRKKQRLVPRAPKTLRFGPFALAGAALSLMLHGGFA
jgi:prepilin peptidase CpaA